MTKIQGLTVNDVVTAALDLLEEMGAEGVSMRAVAKRLDVRMNTVLGHAKSPIDLQELMADAIVARIATGTALLPTGLLGPMRV